MLNRRNALPIMVLCFSYIYRLHAYKTDKRNHKRNHGKSWGRNPLAKERMHASILCIDDLLLSLTAPTSLVPVLTSFSPLIAHGVSRLNATTAEHQECCVAVAEHRQGHPPCRPSFSCFLHPNSHACHTPGKSVSLALPPF